MQMSFRWFAVLDKSNEQESCAVELHNSYCRTRDAGSFTSDKGNYRDFWRGWSLASISPRGRVACAQISIVNFSLASRTDSASRLPAAAFGPTTTSTRRNVRHRGRSANVRAHSQARLKAGAVAIVCATAQSGATVGATSQTGRPYSRHELFPIELKENPPREIEFSRRHACDRRSYFSGLWV